MRLQSLKLEPADLIAACLGVLATVIYFLSGFFEIDLYIKISGLFFLSFVLIVLVTRYKHLVLYCLAFLIPLSVPFKLPGGTIIQAPTEIICVFLFVFLILKLLVGKWPQPRFLKHPLTIFILLDLAWLFVSSCTSEMPLVSFKRLFIKLIYYTGFYFFYFELFSSDLKNIKRVLILQCAGFLIPIISTLSFHSTLGFTTMGSQLASYPFYNDHTMYGAALAFLMPFLLISASTTKPSKEQVLFRVLLLIFALSLFLSYSRAAWLSLILSLIIVLFLKLKINISFLLIGLVFLLCLGYGNRENISQFLSANKELSHGKDVSQHFKSISNVNTDVSNLERVNRWKCAIRMFEDKPIFGFGPGTYQFFYGNYQVRKDMTTISTYSGNKGHAHSEYLNYLSETGLPGLLIFISLVSFVIYYAVKVLRKLTGKFEKNILYALLTGFLTFVIHGFFNGFIEFDKIAMPVFMTMAAIVALDLKQPGRPA